jgi:hypothetical protein
LLKLFLHGDQTVIIEDPEGVCLRGVLPVLNGAALEGSVCEVLHSDQAGIELRYTATALGGGWECGRRLPTHTVVSAYITG